MTTLQWIDLHCEYKNSTTRTQWTIKKKPQSWERVESRGGYRRSWGREWKMSVVKYIACMYKILKI